MSTTRLSQPLAPLQGNNLAPWLMSPWWPADSLDTKQRSLLRILSVATSENIVPAPLVFCLAEEHRGSYRRKLKRLAQLLSSGTSLPDALENSPGVLADAQLLAIRFGHQSGLLMQVFSALLLPKPSAGHSLKARMIELVLYSKIVIVVMFFILTFLMIKIVPSFMSIFDDFDLDLPQITIRLIEISEFLVHYWYVVFFVIIGVLVLLSSRTLKNLFRRVLFPRLIPPVASLRSSELLDLLSVTVAAGRPLAGALSTLARYHLDPQVRRKLLFVFNEVEQGANPWKRMVSTRLLNAKEAAAIETATTPQSRAWTMNRLAGLRRDRFAAKVDAFGNLLQTGVTLCFGAVVLFVGVALLLPLFDLAFYLT